MGTLKEQRVEIITPADAWDMLQHNRAGRSIRQSHVEYLANEMKSGNWQLTHQGIAIDEKGNIIDGQHRLSAIIMADRSVALFVARNVPARRYQFIDCGIKRSIGDTLHISSRDAASCLMIMSVVRRSGKPAPTDLAVLEQAFRPQFSLLNASGVALWGSAPIRAGAALIMRQYNGSAAEGIATFHNDLILHNVRQLPSAGEALLKAETLLRSLLRGAGAGRREVCLRAMYAFDPKNKDIRRMNFAQPLEDKYDQLARSTIIQILNDA